MSSSLTSRSALSAPAHRWRGGHVVVWLWLSLFLGGLLAPGAWGQSIRAPATAVPACSAEASVVELDLARATLLDQACLASEQGGPHPPGNSSTWQSVNLPHRWDKASNIYPNSLWYRFDLNLAAVPKSMSSIYLPRVVMNAQVWVNGVPLDYTGSMTHPVTRNWYVPLIFNVSPSLWKPGVNVVMVRVASGIVARNGLSGVMMGPQDQVGEIYKRRYWVQVDAVRAANVALLTLGLFLLIAWVRDQEQTAMGFLGLAAVGWAWGTLVQVSPDIFTSMLTAIRLSYILTVTSQLLLCLFFFRFGGKKRHWLERLIYALMVLIPAQAIAVANVLVIMLSSILIYALALWSMADAIGHVIKTKRPDGQWLVAACLALVPAGVHDMMVMLGSLPFGSIYWMFYTGPFVLGCITVIVAGDFARSRKDLRDLNHSLADRVAEREGELRSTFERMAELTRNQAVLAERSRILKDMHDGVGAHLTSALRQLQGREEQAVDVPLVTQTLRDSLDQLKLTIDALSLMPGDVEGLLASWRFRLAPRLKAAGIELVWDVDQLPAWPAGQPPILRQIQYILFEGLSNVLQHSGATTLVLSARDLGHHLQVSLIDNGRGWSQADQHEGQGLQTMLTRAQHIGAQLEMLPQADGGLELRLSLPMAAEDTASSVHAVDFRSAAHLATAESAPTPQPNPEIRTGTS